MTFFDTRFDIVFTCIFFSHSRSVLREDINKLHKQLLDERGKTEKLRQEFVCGKLIYFNQQTYMYSKAMPFLMILFLVSFQSMICFLE